MCASSRGRNKTCTTHYISEKKLSGAVLKTINHQISYALDMEKSLAFIKSLPSQQECVTKLTAQFTDRDEEINSCKRHKRSLYEDYKEGIISKEDCIQFGKDYDERITELEQAITKLQGEIDKAIA
jgi:hypothetical protein